MELLIGLCWGLLAGIVMGTVVVRVVGVGLFCRCRIELAVGMLIAVVVMGVVRGWVGFIVVSCGCLLFLARRS